MLDKVEPNGEMLVENNSLELSRFVNRYHCVIGHIHNQLKLKEEYLDLLNQSVVEEKTSDQVRFSSEQSDIDLTYLRDNYRIAASLIHPDKASSEEEMEYRTGLMSALNLAYKNMDVYEIKHLVEEFKNEKKNGFSTNTCQDKRVAYFDGVDIKNKKIFLDLYSVYSKLQKFGIDLISLQANDLRRKTESICKKIANSLSNEAHKNDPIKSLMGDDGDLNKTSIFMREHLIHRTENGGFVRSKSELIIANMLHSASVKFFYEYPIESLTKDGVKYPDFVIFKKNGEAIIWEHLGMLQNESYRNRWEKKLEWYEYNKFIINKNLFITEDDLNGSLDSFKIKSTIEQIQRLL